MVRCAVCPSDAASAATAQEKNVADARSRVVFCGPFAALDDMARRNRTRCLICIDAINEGHRDRMAGNWSVEPR